ncbi:MAG: lamin tail domain-containing protein [Bacteroidales bacterium]|nr:lamin tail domain-containing protein [Bacteroidales bacterium]
MKKSRVLWIAAGILFLSTCLTAQKSTVVIAEVLYDSPLAYSVSTVHEGEFISLYNYEEEDVNIGGWRVQVTDLTSTQKSIATYTIPANTVLPAFSLAVIAPRRSNSTFDVGAFYGSEDSDSSGNITLYTQKLVFPDTRSLIRIYDAQNKVQDELTYDGISEPLSGKAFLRADNGYCPSRPGSESVSIQRKSIEVKETGHTISQTDYFSGTANPVQLYSFLLDEYSYASEAKGSNSLVPVNKTLTGTVTKNQEEKASNITSSQVIVSGKSVYLAEEEVVLGPGFEVKDGAEFEVIVERDSFHVVPMLTYNLWGKHTPDYGVHAKYINQSGAAVVSVQEVYGKNRFKKLKKATGMDGKMCILTTPSGIKCGIGMLWNKNRVGNKNQMIEKKIKTPKDGSNKKRGYILAEFPEFCFVATHYSLSSFHREEMTKSILNEDIIKNCINTGKPIYVAGDMNINTQQEKAITIFNDNGFKVLNDLVSKDHQTQPQHNKSIDLILEYNCSENIYHRLIERGIPILEKDREDWLYNDKVSDHFPYFVKVKTK